LGNKEDKSNTLEAANTRIADRLKQRIGKKILAGAAGFRLPWIEHFLGLATQLDF